MGQSQRKPQKAFELVTAVDDWGSIPLGTSEEPSEGTQYPSKGGGWAVVY